MNFPMSYPLEKTNKHSRLRWSVLHAKHTIMQNIPFITVNTGTMKKLVWLFLLALLPLFLANAADDNEYIPEKPYAWVNDYPNILRANEEVALNKKLLRYQDTTSTQIFIVIMKDHGSIPANMMAAEIGEKWGVGQEGKDNGLVILMYPYDHKVSIQTGYGLEAYIPDAIAKRIIEKEMLPYFRQNQYYQGLDKATDVMIGLLSGKFSADQYRKKTASGGAAPFGFLIFLILFFIFFGQARRRRYSSLGRGIPFWIALSMLSGTRNTHHGSWGNFSSGSGGFGGFTGGGGGSFGGGGASGSW